MIGTDGKRDSGNTELSLLDDEIYMDMTDCPIVLMNSRTRIQLTMELPTQVICF